MKTYPKWAGVPLYPLRIAGPTVDNFAKIYPEQEVVTLSPSPGPGFLARDSRDMYRQGPAFNCAPGTPLMVLGIAGGSPGSDGPVDRSHPLRPAQGPVQLGQPHAGVFCGPGPLECPAPG